VGSGKALVEDWRNYVTGHRLIVAIVAGLVATHVTTNLGMWYHGLGLPDLNFNMLNGYLVFGNSANAFGKDGMQDPVALTLVGAGAHYAQGVAFALIYAFGIHPLLPIANTVLGNFAKAIIWGLILATLSAVGPDQLKWIVALYLWHIVYGFNLGAFYQPKDIPATQEA
jgi:hypothetical protein